MSHPHVLVLARSCVDVLCHTERLPAEGEVLLTPRLTECAGGGARMALALQRGAATTLVANLGGDPAGEHLRSVLRAAGVSVAPVPTLATDRSVVLTGGVDRTIVSARHPLDLPAIAAWLATAPLPAPVAVCGSGEFSAPLLCAAAARWPSALSSYDFGATLRPDIAAAARTARVLCGHAPVLCEITGRATVEAALEEILAGPAEVVALTDGPRGALVATAEGRWQVGAPVVEVLDTTGCGDIFHTTFLTGLLHGHHPRAAAADACAAASAHAAVWANQGLEP